MNLGYAMKLTGNRTPFKIFAKNNNLKMIFTLISSENETKQNQTTTKLHLLIYDTVGKEQ